MAEVTLAKLWGLCVRPPVQDQEQDQLPVGRILRRNGYIIIRLRNSGTGQIDRHYIKESDIADIEDIFHDVTWAHLPLADYLLWVLWVREEVFKILLPLEGIDKAVFLQRACALIKEDMKDSIPDADAKEAFDTLVQEGFIEKYDIDFPEPGDGKYYLPPQGKRIAKRMFKKTEDGVFIRTGLSTIPLESEGTITPANKKKRKPAETPVQKIRTKNIRNAAYEYYSQLLRGGEATRESIAIKHGFTKEKNVLSKNNVKIKYRLDIIEDEIYEAVSLFGSVAKIEDKERARLLTKVYNIFKR